MSALSPAGRKMSGYTASASDSEATEELGAVWLAYKWDALQPLAGCGALSALLTVTTLQSPTSGPCNALAACCVEGRLGAMWSGCAVCCACIQLPPRMWAAVDCCIPGRLMAGPNTQTRYCRALTQTLDALQAPVSLQSLWRHGRMPGMLDISPCRGGVSLWCP